MEIAEALQEFLKEPPGDLLVWLTAGAIERKATFRIKDRDGKDIKFPVDVVVNVDIHPAS